MLEGALETWILLLAFSEAGWQVLRSQRTSKVLKGSLGEEGLKLPGKDVRP